MSPLCDHFLKNMTQTLKLQKLVIDHLIKSLKKLMRGNSLMFRPVVDENRRKFIVSLYKKGGHVTSSVAATTAMVLLSRTDGKSVKNVVATSTWGRCLLQKIAFWRRAATTDKVKIPESTKKEVGLQDHYRITSIVET